MLQSATVIFCKKFCELNRPSNTRRVSHPRHRSKREDLRIPTGKTPRPLLHPNVGAPLPCKNWAGPLTYALAVGQKRGFF
jgi:hypothetical protein